VIIVSLVAIVLPVGGFAFAASQESHDAFCGSCHTQPESTYVQRSTAAQAVDLASYHTTQETRCIDCHSGAGLVGRLGAEMMGAGNAFRWFTKTAIQPAPLTRAISDSNCKKCHAQVTQQGYVPKNQTLTDLGEAQNGHWHLFLSRWQSQAANVGDCVSCHNGHQTDGNAQILFLNDQQTSAVCDSCHRVLARE
jgi:predicted CXXCH cytochrome family protein